MAEARLVHPILNDREVEEFRALAQQHADAVLMADEARAIAGQLLSVLLVVRDVTLTVSNDSDSYVDGGVLPMGPVRANTTDPISKHSS